MTITSYNTNTESTADIETIKLVTISEFLSPINFPKKPEIIEAIKGNAIIIDGDTIHIGNSKVRLYGIDAPEINQTCTINKIIWECGFESSQALENIISAKEVRCEIVDIDRYKRYVAKCFVKNIYLNQYMVQKGWAIAYRYYSDDFINDEEIAEKNKVGISNHSHLKIKSKLSE